VRHTLLLACVVAAASFAAAPAHAADGALAGFKLVDEAPGVSLYRKNQDVLQIIDPMSGGRLRVALGAQTLSGGLIMHERASVATWWAKAKADPAVFSLFNGQFFDARDAEVAPLAFSVKQDGTVYVGYGDKTEYAGKKMALLLGETAHAVIPYDDDPASLARRSEPDAVVGLRWSADKKPRARVGRTMIGVTPAGKTVVFASTAATQRYALGILKRFGVQPSEVVMLDGGGSTQIFTRQGLRIPSRTNARSKPRKLPQVFVVEMGGGE
jgi:hypothetical protein